MYTYSLWYVPWDSSVIILEYRALRSLTISQPATGKFLTKHKMSRSTFLVVDHHPLSHSIYSMRSAGIDRIVPWALRGRDKIKLISRMEYGMDPASFYDFVSLVLDRVIVSG